MCYTLIVKTKEEEENLTQNPRIISQKNEGQTPQRNEDNEKKKKKFHFNEIKKIKL